ncbi:hypothetical protein [Kutzneria sp. NPDC052558]|uniref:hypothetical protein n=1 Tax=Kutzneria sp. NPDC052558 TaxID=3364121 RepID=UPI0037CB417E
MRTGELTHIVGVQVAWWQLGFRGRRQVLGRARYGGTGFGDEVGRAWALQVLLAPWWWRAARVAAAAGAALLVVVIAETGLLTEIRDATVAVLLTVLTAFGAAAVVTWRQTRWARVIAGPAGEHARPQSVLLRKVQLTVAVLLAVATLSVFLQSAAVTAAGDVNCRIQPTDPRLYELSRNSGTGPAYGLCAQDYPTTEKDGTAWIQEINGTYLYWFPSLGADISMSPAMHTAWMRYRDLLGEPADTDRVDGDATYINFAAGYILEHPDQPPTVEPGRYQPTARPDACKDVNRPCLTQAAQRPDGVIELSWRYPNRADAFNVSYWVVGRRGTASYEVATPHFTLPAPEPHETYGFQVQACQKHLLARSTCTPNSNSVAVTTG